MNPNGICTKDLMKSLSDDAKVILGCYFGYLGMPGKSTLGFGMKQSKPTQRAQNALDELVEAGAMTRTGMLGGGVVYTIQVNCSEFARWADRNKRKAKWSVTEPVTSAA